MVISLSEMKNYLRVDHEEDDRLLSEMMETGQRLCMDVARIEDEDVFEELEGVKTAVLFAVAYLYEHREEADHHGLLLSLRALLFGNRVEGF